MTRNLRERGKEELTRDELNAFVRLGGHSKKKEFGDEGQLSKEDSVFNDFGKRRRLEDDKKKKNRGIISRDDKKAAQTGLLKKRGCLGSEDWTIAEHGNCLFFMRLGWVNELMDELEKTS
ncbi:hypothetical protein BY996DRAFT_6478105 [Phakopsora pachyrhizi]|nr:hypothetical protein BY996DRAFT_6478105 [Phakopsora pachyrhizi]